MIFSSCQKLQNTTNRFRIQRVAHNSFYFFYIIFYCPLSQTLISHISKRQFFFYNRKLFAKYGLGARIIAVYPKSAARRCVYSVPTQYVYGRRKRIFHFSSQKPGGSSEHWMRITYVVYRRGNEKEWDVKRAAKLYTDTPPGDLYTVRRDPGAFHLHTYVHNRYCNPAVYTGFGYDLLSFSRAIYLFRCNRQITCCVTYDDVWKEVAAAAERSIEINHSDAQTTVGLKPNTDHAVSPSVYNRRLDVVSMISYRTTVIQSHGLMFVTYETSVQYLYGMA